MRCFRSARASSDARKWNGRIASPCAGGELLPAASWDEDVCAELVATSNITATTATTALARTMVGSFPRLCVRRVAASPPIGSGNKPGHAGLHNAVQPDPQRDP